MKSVFSYLGIAVAVVSFTNKTFAQDHGHLNIGATDITQGAQLIFDNSVDFETNSSYIKTLTYTNGSTYAGYYQGNVTLTVLAATPAFSGPTENAPALGSQMYAQIVSVDGPAGGAFGFWESAATGPTISMASGTTGTNMFRVSQTDGSPGVDPFGHIHGRRFTATKPGIYTVGFKAFDLSTNGVGGGPIHTPSEVIKIYFQAGVNIASVNRTGSTAAVTFGSMIGNTFTLEYATDLAATNWTSLDSVPGNDLLQTLTDQDANTANRFYRIKVTQP